MGKCVSTAKPLTLPQTKQAFIQAIRKGKITKVQQYFLRLHEDFSLGVDAVLITRGSEALTALAVAFESGKVAAVQWLMQQGADAQCVHRAYRHAEKSLLHRLCENGFLDVLKFYLPLYLAEAPERCSDFSLDSDDDMSILLGQPTVAQKVEIEMRRPRFNYTPAIHFACAQGHLAVVQWLWEYFSERFPPADFDVESIDERLHENCALIAVKYAQLDIVRFLYEVCDANFRRLNIRREGALQVAAVGSRSNKRRKYAPIAKYLLEVVGLDVTYRYDETLLICEDAELQLYIESELRRLGITTTKEKLERENESATALRATSGEDAPFADSLSRIPPKAQTDISGISMF